MVRKQHHQRGQHRQSRVASSLTHLLKSLDSVAPPLGSQGQEVRKEGSSSSPADLGVSGVSGNSLSPFNILLTGYWKRECLFAGLVRHCVPKKGLSPVETWLHPVLSLSYKLVSGFPWRQHKAWISLNVSIHSTDPISTDIAKYSTQTPTTDISFCTAKASNKPHPLQPDTPTGCFAYTTAKQSHKASNLNHYLQKPEDTGTARQASAIEHPYPLNRCLWKCAWTEKPSSRPWAASIWKRKASLLCHLCPYSEQKLPQTLF